MAAAISSLDGRQDQLRNGAAPQIKILLQQRSSENFRRRTMAAL
jgi:hypothetical protein